MHKENVVVLVAGRRDGQKRRVRLAKCGCNWTYLMTVPGFLKLIQCLLGLIIIIISIYTSIQLYRKLNTLECGIENVIVEKSIENKILANLENQNVFDLKNRVLVDLQAPSTMSVLTTTAASGEKETPPPNTDSQAVLMIGGGKADFKNFETKFTVLLVYHLVTIHIVTWFTFLNLFTCCTSPVTPPHLSKSYFEFMYYFYCSVHLTFLLLVSLICAMKTDWTTFTDVAGFNEVIVITLLVLILFLTSLYIVSCHVARVKFYA